LYNIYEIEVGQFIITTTETFHNQYICTFLYFSLLLNKTNMQYISYH